MQQQHCSTQSLRNFQILQKLGEGSYSQVFKVERLTDNKIYAMKKVKMNSLKEKERENAVNEVRILASFNDPYIVGYKEAFIDEDSQVLCVVMEYANEGDLQQMIQAAQKKSGPIPEPTIWRALYQMTRGLKKLHEMKIVHRDLKCANVFIHDGVFKLGDLNVSKVAKAGLVHTQTGTPYYASPEVWRDEPYDMKSDLWSLGCVVYEMAALKPPFRATDMQGLFAKVQRGQFDPVPKQYSRDLQTILSSMIQVVPQRRPNCIQLLNNPLLLRHIDDHAVLDKSVGQKNELLQTIQLPRNLRSLKDHLPKSKYESSELNRSVDRNLPPEPNGKPNPAKQNQRVQSALPLQRSEKKPAQKVSQQESYDQYPSAPRYQGQKPKPKLDGEPSLQKQHSQHSVVTPTKLANEFKSLPTQPQQSPPKQLVSVQHPSVQQVPLQISPKRVPEPVKVNPPQDSLIEEPFQGLVVDGLHKLNPMSIQSILCQPVLNINESPFPVQAKVLKKKVESAKPTLVQSPAQPLPMMPVRGVHNNVLLDTLPSINQKAANTPKIQPTQPPQKQKRERPESAQLGNIEMLKLKDEYQHYYPMSQQQELYLERMKQNQTKSQQRIQEQFSSPNLNAKAERITSAKRQQSAQGLGRVQQQQKLYN